MRAGIYCLRQLFLDLTSALLVGLLDVGGLLFETADCNFKALLCLLLQLIKFNGRILLSLIYGFYDLFSAFPASLTQCINGAVDSRNLCLLHLSKFLNFILECADFLIHVFNELSVTEDLICGIRDFIANFFKLRLQRCGSDQFVELC